MKFDFDNFCSLHRKSIIDKRFTCQIRPIKLLHYVVHTYINTCVCIYVQLCMHSYMITYKHSFMHVYVLFIYSYIHTYAYMHGYTCRYTHKARQRIITSIQWRRNCSGRIGHSRCTFWDFKRPRPIHSNRAVRIYLIKHVVD